MAQVERRSDGSADPDGAVVTVTGELDIATAPLLDYVLDRAIEGRPAPHVIVDLRGVTFIDCAALGVLIRARNRLGDRLWLRNVPPAVTRLLDLTDLTDLFAVRDQDDYLRLPGSQECNLSTTTQALGDARQEQAQSGAPGGSRGVCAPVHDPAAPRVAIADAGRVRCILSGLVGDDCTVVNPPHTDPEGGVVVIHVNRSAAAGSQVATRQEGPVEVRDDDLGRPAGTNQAGHRLTGPPWRRVPVAGGFVVALSVGGVDGGVSGGVGEGCC
jgi:anti-sigma B factor antagonist